MDCLCLGLVSEALECVDSLRVVAASDGHLGTQGDGFRIAMFAFDQGPRARLRFYRHCKAAVIHEGTREIHKIMQADYLLGYRTDRPICCELPAVERAQ
jgi:hypothetical protein